MSRGASLPPCTKEIRHQFKASVHMLSVAPCLGGRLKVTQSEKNGTFHSKTYTQLQPAPSLAPSSQSRPNKRTRRHFSFLHFCSSTYNCLHLLSLSKPTRQGYGKPRLKPRRIQGSAWLCLRPLQRKGLPECLHCD